MKKIGFIMFFSILMICVIITEKKTVQASEGSVITIKTEKVYSGYDITNDGKKDKILVKKTRKEDIWYGCLKVFVNGKCALNIKSYYYNVYIKIIKLSNKKSYLYVYLPGDNGDGPSDIYVYKNKKFISEVNLIQSVNQYDAMGYHNQADIQGVSGNNILVKMYSMSYGLAGMDYQSIYTYKSGRLVLKSKTHKIYGYYNKSTYGRVYLTVRVPFYIYKDKKSKVKSGKLGKGTKLIATKCYISGRLVSYFVKTKNGKTGWFRSPKSCKQLFKEIGYAGGIKKSFIMAQSKKYKYSYFMHKNKYKDSLELYFGGWNKNVEYYSGSGSLTKGKWGWSNN